MGKDKSLQTSKDRDKVKGGIDIKWKMKWY